VLEPIISSDNLRTESKCREGGSDTVGSYGRTSPNPITIVTTVLSCVVDGGINESVPKRNTLACIFRIGGDRLYVGRPFPRHRIRRRPHNVRVHAAPNRVARATRRSSRHDSFLVFFHADYIIYPAGRATR